MGQCARRTVIRSPTTSKFWNIGNEPWGTFQLGYTDLKYFILKNNEFATAMRQADPSITLIGSGKMLQDDNVPQRFACQVRWPPSNRCSAATTIGPAASMRETKGNFEIMAEHWYASGGHHWDQEKARNLPLDKPSDDAFVKSGYDAARKCALCC